MANIIIYPSKATHHKIIKYADNPEKTRKDLVSNINLDFSRNIANQMMETHDIYKCKGDRRYYDIVQSFKAGEVTPEKAHQIGRELAEKYFPGYEVHIATHINTEHVHNHIIVNSVSLETGRKWDNKDHETREIKELSNKICAREHLSTIDLDKKAEERITHGELRMALRGEESFKIKLRDSILVARENSRSWIEFRDKLKKLGVETRVTDKSISYKLPEMGQPIRGKKLGDIYTKGSIEHELNGNLERAKAAGQRRDRADDNRGNPDRAIERTVKELDGAERGRSAEIAERLSQTELRVIDGKVNDLNGKTAAEHANDRTDRAEHDKQQQFAFQKHRERDKSNDRERE
jgi:hypothetical protein